MMYACSGHTSTPPVKSREVKKVTEDDIPLSGLVVFLEGNSVNPEHMKTKTSHQKCREHHHEQELAACAMYMYRIKGMIHVRHGYGIECV